MFTLFYFLVSLSCLELTPSFSLFFLRSFALPLSPFVFSFSLFISFPYFLFFPPVLHPPCLWSGSSVFLHLPSSALSLSEYLSPFSLSYLLIYPFSFLLRLFLRLSSTLALFNPIFSSPFHHTTSLFLDLSHFSSGFTSSMPRRFELSTCQSLFTRDFLSCASWGAFSVSERGFRIFFLDFVSIYTCMCE